jgi:NTE family protein
MARQLAILLVSLIFCIEANAQKVGVVLSGGGAKGIAHVGVLKALEEEEIPIDYVVGTSMGGIVAGLYASGHSPHQMEEMMLSGQFLGWVNGRLENGYNYFYNKPDGNPSILKINLSLDSTLNLNLNTSIANDLSLNFALAEIFAQPSAIARNNFDSLFVPLRVVAADIFTQNSVTLRSGNLSDAIRATQSVPFFYKPIRVEGKYLFDGGVYNNFPVDVMLEDFQPDVLIGCNVSSKVYNDYPYGEDEELIAKSLMYMLLDKSDPATIPATGVYIQPDLSAMSSFDFSKVRSMIDSGYAQTKRQIAEIRQKVGSSAKRSCEAVAEKRNEFNNKTVPLVVDKITYQGFTGHQQIYLNRYFNRRKRPLYFSDIKEGYYKLVADDYFRNVYPNFLYDTAASQFRFQLLKRPDNNFQIDFGGVVSTRNISNVFLGLNYYHFNRALTHVMANLYAGNFYKSAQLKGRIDISSFGRFYLEPEATFNDWDYLEGNDIVVKSFDLTVLKRIDRKVGMSIGVPLGLHFKASLNGHYINNRDQYIDTEVLSSADTLDILKLDGPRLGLAFSTNTLNRKQYASQGRRYEFAFDWFSLHEHFEPGTTSLTTQEVDRHVAWVRAKVKLEQYFKAGIYSSGYLVEGVLSNQPFLSNYMGTIVNTPAFNPLQDSPTLMLPNFRAFNYAAGGWRNIFALRNNLDLRLEGFVFKPFETIVKSHDQLAVLDPEAIKVYVAGTAGLVLHSSVGPISLSVNYYSDPNYQLGVLLHVGFLMFHKTSLD